MSVVGGIEFEGLFGGLRIINKPANRLPQDLATAVGDMNEGMLGATYVPLWIVGDQVVNGVKYYLVCKQIRATKNSDVAIVNVVLYIPPIKSDGTRDKARVEKIIEEADLDSELSTIFRTATSIVGVGYKALAYVGKQVVNGTVHHFICQATPIYPGCDPYAALVSIHTTLDGHSTILSVDPIMDGLVGYAFTWMKLGTSSDE